MPGRFQKNQPPKRGKAGDPPKQAAPASDESVNYSHAEIQKWFRTVKFRRNLIGGINEAQLWKQLSELNALYDKALNAERARYDSMIQNYTAVTTKKLVDKEEQIEKLRQRCVELRRAANLPETEGSDL